MDTEPNEQQQQQTLSLSARIEAALFFRGEPLSRSTLSQILDVDTEELEAGLSSLEHELAGRGIALVRKDDAVALSTSSAAASVVEALQKEELGGELGKAALETLAIIAYQAPVSRSKIDYIRGVNSTFILRHLLVRGLVERVPNPDDQRSFLYRPTFDLLGHLGLSRIEELPEFESVKQEVEQFEAATATAAEAENENE